MMEEEAEGREGAKRIEAFSDGVIAIIITIMVLELHAPEQPGISRLLRLWPTFLSYALSYAYVAIYWVNHHRMFQFATRVTNALVWSNITLLFTLSLIPFATAYVGGQLFTRDATLIYMISLLLPAIAYTWLESVIRRTGGQGEAARAYHLGTLRKSKISTVMYAVGLALTFVAPWLGLACAALMALLWFLPKSRLDRIFGR